MRQIDFARLCVAVAALLISPGVIGEQRELASDGDVRFTLPADYTCGVSAPVTIVAADSSLFVGDRTRLQHLMGLVRMAVSFQCPGVSRIELTGTVDQDEVFSGYVQARDNWRLVSISLEKQLAADRAAREQLEIERQRKVAEAQADLERLKEERKEREEIQEKGEKIARESGVRWRLVEENDPLSRVTTLVATNVTKNSNGATTETRVECGAGYSGSQYVPRLTTTITHGSVPVRVHVVVFLGQLAEDIRATGRARINEEIFSNSLWIQREFTNVFRKQHVDDEQIKGGLFWFRGQIVYDWVVELPTDLGPIVIKAPTFDPAIHAVIQSCEE